MKLHRRAINVLRVPSLSSLRVASSVSLASRKSSTMSPSRQQTLWCAFSDKLGADSPVSCAVSEETHTILNEKFKTNDKSRARISTTGFCFVREESFPGMRSSSRRKGIWSFLQGLLSSPPRNQSTQLVLKRISTRYSLYHASFSSGPFANNAGIPYRPPPPGILLDSPGRGWDYQASSELADVLRKEIERHYHYYAVERRIYKTTMPLYLSLSGAGTGKSRNATELHHTAYKCFDGTYYRHKDEELASRLRDSMVFHVSLENGTSSRPEEDPWTAIGARMLLQLLQEDEAAHPDIESIISQWHPPTRSEVIKLLTSSTGSPSASQSRTIFLVVDGLHSISATSAIHATLTKLGDLTQFGFIIVCVTSTVSGPVDLFLNGARRRGISLPCSPLIPPQN